METDDGALILDHTVNENQTSKAQMRWPSPPGVPGKTALLRVQMGPRSLQTRQSPEP